MGKNATIGAGSVVTKSVDSHTLALSRAEMPTIPLRANSKHLTRCKKGTEECSKMGKRGILPKKRIHMNSCGPELGARRLLERVLTLFSLPNGMILGATCSPKALNPQSSSLPSESTLDFTGPVNIPACFPMRPIWTNCGSVF
jgi:hypothetical protein